jgi:ATP-dependent 26S proteasome regulatory subunit
VRRLHAAIEFPLPDARDRLRIWQSIWPSNATLRELNFEFLAQRFSISGGNIRNIALAAAFLAAADGGSVTMTHILDATRREYQKMGKIIAEGEFDNLPAANGLRV